MPPKTPLKANPKAGGHKAAGHKAVHASPKPPPLVGKVHQRYGAMLAPLAERLDVPLEVLVAVVATESLGGEGFAEVRRDGRSERRPVIKFEQHVFKKYFTDHGKDKARLKLFDEIFSEVKHEKKDKDGKPVLDKKGKPVIEKTEQFYRTAKDAPKIKHSVLSQDVAQTLFDFARGLDGVAPPSKHTAEESAYMAFSYGVGQVMGFNHALVVDPTTKKGFRSAKEMYEYFSQSEENQVQGLGDYVENKAGEVGGMGIVEASWLDLKAFAALYNGGGNTVDYSTKLQKRIDEYKAYTKTLSSAEPASPPLPPLGLGGYLTEMAQTHASRYRLFASEDGEGVPDPLERMGYRHPAPLTLNQTPAPAPPPDPRLNDFSKGMRKVSTGLTLTGVAAAGVKLGLAHAGGFGTAVTSLGLAGGVLGLLNFATKVADGTLNDPLAEQTMLKHAPRLGALGDWLQRNEEGVKRAAVVSNWAGGAAAALSVASGAMALTGVGLPVAAVLGGMALGLTIGSVVLNPVGVVGVGLKVYDGLKFMGGLALRGAKAVGRAALTGLDLALYGGMKAVGGAVEIGGKAASFAKDKAQQGWGVAKSVAGWVGQKALGAAHKTAEVAKAGAGWVAQKGQQAWGGAKAAGGLAADKGVEGFAWLMRNRPVLVGLVESFEADASAVSVMGFAAAAAMAAAGLLFPPLLPVAASTAVVAEALSVASGSAGYLKSGLIMLGTVDGSVPPEVAYHSMGESMVKFVASFFGGKIVERMGKAVKAATKAEGSVLQGGTKLSATSQGKILEDKATDTEKKAPYAVIDPFMKRLEGMMASGLNLFLSSPVARFTPFYHPALAVKGVLGAAAKVNQGLAWLSDQTGKGLKTMVDAAAPHVKAGLHKAGEGAAWLGGKVKGGFEWAKDTAVGAGHLAKDKAVGAWGWLKGKAHAAADKGIDLAGQGIAAGFGLVGDLARKRQLALPPKIVGGIADGGLTGVFPASGAPPDEAAKDAHRHAAIGAGATIFINGVKNTLAEHVHSARRLAHETQKPVVGVFNASDMQLGKTKADEASGIGLGDFVESIDDTTSLDSVNPAIKTTTDLLLKYGDPESPPKGKLNVVAHSQGSIILSKALWRASNQKKGNLAKIDATTFGNATFFFPKGASYHHYVFDDDVIANKLGTNSGAERFFNDTRLGKAVSKHSAKRITGQDNPEVDDAVAHTTILHQGGSGARPHGMAAGHHLAADGKGGYATAAGKVGDVEYDGRADYVSSLGAFRDLEKAEAGKPKARQTERGRVGVNNAFGKAISEWASGKVESLGKGMQGLGLTRSGGLLAKAGAKGKTPALNATDRKLYAASGQKVQRRSPDAGPEPRAGGIVEGVLAAGEGHRTVDAGLAARLGPGFAPGARLHDGPAAAEAARGLGAEAFTVGGDVFFGAGRYDPHSEGGQRLLAHELTHVAQQTGDDARFYTPSGGDAMEAQAQTAERVFAARGGANLAVGGVALSLDESAQGHAQRLSELTQIAIDAAGDELGERPGEVESLALDLSLDVARMDDAEIVAIIRREIVKGVLAAAPPDGAPAPAVPRLAPTSMQRVAMPASSAEGQPVMQRVLMGTVLGTSTDHQADFAAVSATIDATHKTRYLVATSLAAASTEAKPSIVHQGPHSVPHIFLTAAMGYLQRVGTWEAREAVAIAQIPDPADVASILDYETTPPTEGTDARVTYDFKLKRYNDYYQTQYDALKTALSNKGPDFSNADTLIMALLQAHPYQTVGWRSYMRSNKKYTSGKRSGGGGENRQAFLQSYGDSFTDDELATLAKRLDLKASDFEDREAYAQFIVTRLMMLFTREQAEAILGKTNLLLKAAYDGLEAEESEEEIEEEAQEEAESGSSPKKAKQLKAGTPNRAGGAPLSGGLPPNLRLGIESLSGFDMGGVNVHYGSSRPARLGALAYAQGTDIHLAPGQERHLPHEAWHVVQQMQGRVRPTMQMKGAGINDDAGLEAEADAMGARAAMDGLAGRQTMARQGFTGAPAVFGRTLQRQPEMKFEEAKKYIGQSPKENLYPSAAPNPAAVRAHIIAEFDQLASEQIAALRDKSDFSEEEKDAQELEVRKYHEDYRKVLDLMLDQSALFRMLQPLEEALDADRGKAVPKPSPKKGLFSRFFGKPEIINLEDIATDKGPLNKGALGRGIATPEEEFGFSLNQKIPLGILSADAFLSLPQSGLVPKDIGAGFTHGEYSHRIQWVAIMEKFREDMDAFQEDSSKGRQWHHTPLELVSNLFGDFGWVQGALMDKGGNDPNAIFRHPDTITDNFRHDPVTRTALPALSEAVTNRYEKQQKLAYDNMSSNIDIGKPFKPVIKGYTEKKTSGEDSKYVLADEGSILVPRNPIEEAPLEERIDAQRAKYGMPVISRVAGDPGHAVGSDTSGGLPANLRSGIEAHSGFDMSAVRVHHNSPEPARVGALAYAQGTDIHLAPGQERHLPHEAWHVVQQMQGRVQPTMQMKGAGINDDAGLEREADLMGTRALMASKPQDRLQAATGRTIAIQRVRWKETDVVSPAGLSPQLSVGLAAAQASPTTKPAVRFPWVEERTRAENPHTPIPDADVKTYVEGLWGKAKGSMKADTDESSWKQARIKATQDADMAKYEKGLAGKMTARWKELKWNETFGNTDLDLVRYEASMAIPLVNLSEYYAEPATPFALGDTFWGQNRILRYGGDGGDPAAWFVTSDHYKNFKKIV